MSSVGNIPYRRNPQFVGRAAELTRLAGLLAREETPAICGAGGMGKTQLAVELAYQVRAHYPGGVWWLTMEQAAGIAAQVAAQAGPDGLDLPGWEPTAFERNLAGVRAAWREPIRRLLIFDNLEAPDLLREWQPHEGGCRVLITSRRQTWAGRTGVWPLLLPPLERDASLVLLLAERERAGGPTREAVLADPAELASAHAICAAVGDLPLALALAGSYLGTTPHTPLTHYRAALEKNVLEHPSMHAEWLDEALPGHHVPSIVATLHLSYDRLAEGDAGDERARRLLHRAAWCAPAPIPRPLLVRLAAVDPRADPTDEAEETAAFARHRLAALGLIEPLPADGTARLHRLLAAYVRTRAPDPADDAAVEGALRSELYAIGSAGYPLAAVPYLDHAREAAARAEARGDVEAAALLNNLGYLLYAQGDYGAARPLYERALAIREQALGPTHPATAQSLNNLALLLHEQRDLAAARPLYERALAIREQVLGPTHPDTAESLNDLAMLLKEQGDLGAARPLFERALAITEQVLGPTHPATGMSAVNLAGLLKDQGDYDAARPLYERGLTIHEQALGPSHPATATSLNNLAGLLKAQGDYGAARPLYERALAIFEQALGPDHPDTRKAQANLMALPHSSSTSSPGDASRPSSEQRE